MTWAPEISKPSARLEWEHRASTAKLWCKVNCSCVIDSVENEGSYCAHFPQKASLVKTEVLLFFILKKKRSEDSHWCIVITNAWDFLCIYRRASIKVHLLLDQLNCWTVLPSVPPWAGYWKGAVSKCFYCISEIVCSSWHLDTENIK